MAILLLALYALGQPWYARGHISDVHATTFPAWHLVESGSWDLTEFSEVNPWFVEVPGGVWSNRSPGAIGVAVAAYAITSPFTDGFEDWPGTLAAVLTAWLAVLVVAATAERIRGATWFLAVILFGLGTATWGVAAEQLWPHAPAQLAVALAVWLLVRNRPLGSGVAMAVVVLIRPTVLLIGLGVAVAYAWTTRSYKSLMRLGLPPAIAGLFYLAYNRLLFGSWSPTAAYEAVGGFVAEFDTWGMMSNIASSFADPSVGVFIWSPWLLLGLLVTHSLRNQVQPWLMYTPWIAVAYVAAHSLVEISSGALFYNYRYQLEAVTLAAPLLVVASNQYDSTTPKRLLMTAAIAVSVFLQAAFVFVSMCWIDDDGSFVCQLFP